MQKIDIFEYVKCMAALIRAEERKKCTELRLQLIHFEVLDYLSQSNQYTDTPAATASYFGMTRGTVSQSLIVLEKKGYIEKCKDDEDKRIIHVHLQESGKAILKKTRRTTLFNNAENILKDNVLPLTDKKHFIYALNALQKATTPTFNPNKNTALHPQKTTIFNIIATMSRLIRAEERKRCTALKLQMAHFQIIEYLAICNKYSDTPAAIANYLGMTRGTVSQSLIILEKKEFIQKIRDEKDKRVYHIKLLDNGLRTLNKATPSSVFKKATNILNKELPAQINNDIFIKALTALQKANNSRSFGICKTCQNFTQTRGKAFCELTQESLKNTKYQQLCQEHKPSV